MGPPHASVSSNSIIADNKTESLSSKSNRHRMTGRTKIDLKIPNLGSCFSKTPETLKIFIFFSLLLAVRGLFKVCRKAEKSLGARQLQGMCISPFKFPAFVEGCAYTLKTPIFADRDNIFLTPTLKSLPRLFFFFFLVCFVWAINRVELFTRTPFLQLFFYPPYSLKQSTERPCSGLDHRQIL